VETYALRRIILQATFMASSRRSLWGGTGLPSSRHHLPTPTLHFGHFTLRANWNCLFHALALQQHSSNYQPAALRWSRAVLVMAARRDTNIHCITGHLST
jgi:hypothetical protein